MSEFDIVDTNGFLGTKLVGAGNTEKLTFAFDDFLDDGISIGAATATVTSVLSSVATPSLSENHRSVFALVTVTATSETFTLALQVDTTDGQTLNYTVRLVVP